MKTFKEHDSIDKGYYIDDNGHAVVTEPVGNYKSTTHHSNIFVKEDAAAVKAIKSAKKWDDVDDDGSHDEDVAEHHDISKEITHSKIAHAGREERLKRTGNRDHTPEAVHSMVTHSNGASVDIAKTQIENHNKSNGKPATNMWANSPSDKKKAQWQRHHDNMLPAYHKAGVKTIGWCGVSARTHDAIRKSKTKVMTSPAATCTSISRKSAEDFARDKSKKTAGKSNVFRYNAYHIDEHDEVLHVHPHSDYPHEHEVALKAHSKWKHIGTTNHSGDKLMMTHGPEVEKHIVDHYVRHTEESK